MWTVFQKSGGFRLAPLQDVSLIGSSPHVQIQLPGKSIRALHAELRFSNDHWVYSDFVGRQSVRLDSEKIFRIGPWEASVAEDEYVMAAYYTKLLANLKTHLKGSDAITRESAFEKLREENFACATIPLEVRVRLQKSLDECSLRSPIERLLDDPDVTDILVEKYDRVLVERDGELLKAEDVFESDESYRIYLENLVNAHHKTIDEVHPFVDFHLENGSRVHMISPPATQGEFYLSIRKPLSSVATWDDLLSRGMMSAATADDIQQLLDERKNILISGATGSGKTTLLRALLSRCHENERLIVLEDTHELKVRRERIVYLATRTDCRGKLPPITLRDLVKQSLRMRPDRLIVGEVRGDEALELLAAMNTGHRGCMGTLHANSARDAIFRLRTLVQAAKGSLSEQVVVDLICRNIGAVIHCDKDSGGFRKVREIGFVRGRDAHNVLMEIQG